jgi:CXXC-20-CXXC protein
MRIQKCKNCDNQFKWKVVYLSLLLGYKPITCTKCGSNHKIIFSSRITIGLLTALPTIASMNFFIFNLAIPFLLYLIIVLIGIALITLVFPYIARYYSINI